MVRKKPEKIKGESKSVRRRKNTFKKQDTGSIPYDPDTLVSRYFSDMTRPENALIPEEQLIELAKILEAAQEKARELIVFLYKKGAPPLVEVHEKMRQKFVMRFGRPQKNTKGALEEFAYEVMASDELSAAFKILEIPEGVQVVNDILCGNLRLVVSVARVFWSRRSKQIAIEDLIQVGNIGLLKAIARFDWHLGYKFSTYAVWWIRHAISREYADLSSLIRIPVHVHDAFSRILVAARQFGIDIDGRNIPAEDLANAVGISVKSLWHIISVVKAAHHTLSLEMPIGDNSDCLGDTIADHDVDIPGARLENIAVNTTMREAMQTVLTGMERDVIAKRFGLNEGSERTLEDIGKDYDLTRERIRQIEAKALEKLARAFKKQAA